MIGRLRPFAAALLLLIAATGSVLFVAEAVAIAANPVFRLKVILILLALANVIVNEWALRRRGDATASSPHRVAVACRLAGRCGARPPHCLCIGTRFQIYL